MKKAKGIMMIIGGVLLAVVLVFTVIDGSWLPKRYASVWSVDYLQSLPSDQQRLIAYGLRAASSHNSQPWLVKAINEDTLELYADLSKALPVVDGDYKQLLMSQGAFIESLKRGAQALGYSVEIEYHDLDLEVEQPKIATIRTKKLEGVQPADLTTGSTYDAEADADNADLKLTVKSTLQAFPTFTYELVEQVAEVEALEALLLEGTTIESYDEAATKELLNVFRFTEWEKNQYRYGLSLNSVPALMKPFIQPIVKLSAGDMKGFGDSSITQFKDRLASQSKYLIIKTSDAKLSAYIQSGIIYQQLVNQIKGYSLRPAMQVLENFPAMQKLNHQFQNQYGKDQTVVWVIGLQERTSNGGNSNPRHLVEDIIIK